MGSIKAENRTKEDTTTIIIYENGEFVSPVEDAPVTVVAPKEGETAVAEESGEKKRYGFFLDKPWYYRIGLAVGCGMVMGILASLMIMSAKQAPKSSSAYQSLLVLLKENSTAKEILGDNLKSTGKLTGKSEENWANFSIKMQGKKSSAMVNAQAFRQGDNWRFTVVSLDTKDGRVYLCKSSVC